MFRRTDSTTPRRLYRRGNRLYFWYKNEFGHEVQRKTPYNVGDERNAAAYAAEFQRLFDELPRQTKSSVYLIKLSEHRVKVGHTDQRPARRLKAFRTVIPEAELVAVWSGDEDDEAKALAILPGRVGNSEVFECSSEEAAAMLDLLLGPHTVPKRRRRKMPLKDLLVAPVGMPLVPVDS